MHIHSFFSIKYYNYVKQRIINYFYDNCIKLRALSFFHFRFWVRSKHVADCRKYSFQKNIFQTLYRKLFCQIRVIFWVDFISRVFGHDSNRHLIRILKISSKWRYLSCLFSDSDKFFFSNEEFALNSCFSCNSSYRSAKERGSHDAWSWAAYFHQGSLCDAETGFLRPETAKDTSGQWNIIVQSDDVKQRVPIEMCRQVLFT